MNKLKNIEIPAWLKLDNAATIYPSTLTRKYASMFRMTITLNEKIDKDILEESLKNVIKRFPTFRYKLKTGLFWCYFKHIKGIPYIQEVVVKGKKNGIGQEVGLIAEVFLNQEAVSELKVENIEKKLKAEISEVCRELPIYKRITDVEIRETEFNKTTTNKIKR